MTAHNTSTPRSSSESCNTIPRGDGRVHGAFVIALVFLTMQLGACAIGNSDKDKDGVPAVNLRGEIVQSTDANALAYYKNYGGRLPAKRVVTVDAKQLSLAEFVQTYCAGKDTNLTCANAKKIMMMDATRGPRENLPAGV